MSDRIITAACARGTPKGHANCGGRVRINVGHAICKCPCHPWNKA